jgi:hypothetical protein
VCVIGVSATKEKSVLRDRNIDDFGVEPIIGNLTESERYQLPLYRFERVGEEVEAIPEESLSMTDRQTWNSSLREVE